MGVFEDAPAVFSLFFLLLNRSSGLADPTGQFGCIFVLNKLLFFRPHFFVLLVRDVIRGIVRFPPSWVCSE